MLDTMFGWYLRENLGCEFTSIVFEMSLLEETTKKGVGIINSIDGTKNKEKFTTSSFFITETIVFTFPGYLKIYCYPDNDTIKKFFLIGYNSTKQTISPPKICRTDLVLDIENPENQVNNLLLVFNGFWILDERLPEFTITCEKILTALDNIDMQTLQALGSLDTIISLLTQYLDSLGVPYTIPEYYKDVSSYFMETYTKVTPTKLFCKRR